MNYSSHVRGVAAWLIAGVAVAPAASARNTQDYFPISEVTKSFTTQESMGNDISFSFGNALAQEIAGQPETFEEVSVKSVASPVRSSDPQLNEQQKSDRRTCREAFRKALSELAARARAREGNAVINIVSNYGGKEMNSPTEYECHSGFTRSVVELKGRIARASLKGPANSYSGTLPSQRSGGDTPLANARAMQSSNGDIADISLLPFTKEKMVEGYKWFLARPLPRAFAFSASGNWYTAFGYPKEGPSDPAERAVSKCEEHSGNRCFLYAVNGMVVYKPVPNNAPINDSGRLPHVSDKMVERYEYFLTRPLPRAFAVSENGDCWMAWGRKKDGSGSVEERAVRDCEKNSTARCVLYAVDDAVVFNSTTGK